MDSDEILEKLWDAVITRAERTKANPINYLWESKLGKDRVLYVNGTKAACEVDGATLEPFNVLLIWNGWPVASFGPFRGVLMSAPAEKWSEVIEAIANG